MKILRFYTKLPPLPGGMENHINRLSLHQVDQGNEVTVLFNQGDKVSDIDILILGKIKLYKIKPQFVAFVIFYLTVIFHLLVSRTKADVVHVHGDWSSLLFIQYLKKLTRAPVACFSFHGHFRPDKFMHTKILLRLINKADIVLINGYRAYSEIKEKLVSFDGEIHWRPSGISSVFTFTGNKNPTNKFKIICVANLVKRKNLGFVLDLAKSSPNIDYSIVGDGPEKEYLESRIKHEQITNVKLSGRKTEVEIVDLLNSSDIFLSTALTEGTPTAVIEAMACGLPIVASDAGNLSELITDYENGFVIKNFDESEYFEKINLIKNNQELIEKIKKNNILKAQEFGWKKVSKEISTLFKKTLIRNSKNVSDSE